jgi:hypothetical protein
MKKKRDILSFSNFQVRIIERNGDKDNEKSVT